jgi:hypothetical protein
MNNSPFFPLRPGGLCKLRRPVSLLPLLFLLGPPEAGRAAHSLPVGPLFLSLPRSRGPAQEAAAAAPSFLVSLMAGPRCQPRLPPPIRSRAGLQTGEIRLCPIFFGLIHKPCSPIRCMNNLRCILSVLIFSIC